jgi:hypothetical protein
MTPTTFSSLKTFSGFCPKMILPSGFSWDGVPEPAQCHGLGLTKTNVINLITL